MVAATRATWVHSQEFLHECSWFYLEAAGVWECDCGYSSPDRTDHTDPFFRVTP